MDLDQIAERINRNHEFYQRNMALHHKCRLIAGLHLLAAVQAGHKLKELLMGDACPSVETAKKHIQQAKRYLRENAIDSPTAMSRLEAEIEELKGKINE